MLIKNGTIHDAVNALPYQADIALRDGVIAAIGPGLQPLDGEEILDAVWGRDYFGELKIVDVNIRRLRIKIEDDPTNPAFITTVWGYGYKWGF